MFKNQQLNRMLGRGSTGERSAADEKTPMDRFRERIQEASIEDIQRQQEQEQRQRERAMRYWQEA
jgi:hypothetical protein